MSTEGLTDANSTTGTVYITIDAGTTTSVGEMTIGPSEVTVGEVEQKVRKRATIKKIRVPEVDELGEQTVSGDDLVIYNAGDSIRIASHDYSEKTLVRVINSQYAFSPSYHGGIAAFRKFIVFDKNMNCVIPDDRTSDFKGNRKTTGSRYPRVPHIYREDNSQVGVLHKKWIIVDKHEFIASRGSRLKVRSQSMTKEEKLEAKRRIKSDFNFAEEAIATLKSLVNSVYDNDNFEILYHFEPGSTFHEFEIFVQFPNLEIRNSIELTHTIENLVVNLSGRVYKSEKLKYFRLYNYIMGMRTHFSEDDAVVGYAHSHLPSNALNFASFCMGEGHFLSGVDRNNFARTIKVTPLDFESKLVAMFDHISWESLEGGPHFRMERINDKLKPGTESPYVPGYYQIGSLGSSISVHLVNYIIGILKKKNLAAIKDCFTTSYEANGATIRVDHEEFVKQFIRTFTKEELLDIRNKFPTQDYVACDRTGIDLKFFKKVNKPFDRNVKIGQTLSKMIPVYMNGKYIRPTITRSKQQEQNDDEKNVPVFSIALINHFASVIKGCIIDNIKKYNDGRREEAKVSRDESK